MADRDVYLANRGIYVKYTEWMAMIVKLSDLLTQAEVKSLMIYKIWYNLDTNLCLTELFIIN